MQEEKKEYFLNTIQKMQPNEVKHLEAIIVWDKNRYYRNGDLEYYIEEKEKHFIEYFLNTIQLNDRRATDEFYRSREKGTFKKQKLNQRLVYIQQNGNQFR